MRLPIITGLFVTEVFYENRVLYVFDDCTVRQCVREILNNLQLEGAAYLLDNDGHLASARKLSSARGDVRFFLLTQQKGHKYVQAINKLSRNFPPGKVTIAFGDDRSLRAQVSATAERVLQHILPLCTCSGAYFLYLADEAGPVAPSLPLSSTFGNLSVALEKDYATLEYSKYGKPLWRICTVEVLAHRWFVLLSDFPGAVRILENVEVPDFRLHLPATRSAAATATQTTPRSRWRCSLWNLLGLSTPSSSWQIRQDARFWALFFSRVVLIPSAEQRAIVKGKMKELTASGRITVARRSGASRAWWPSKTDRNTAANASIKEEKDQSAGAMRSWWSFGTTTASQAPETVRHTPQEYKLEDLGEPVSRVRFASTDVVLDQL